MIFGKPLWLLFKPSLWGKLTPFHFGIYVLYGYRKNKEGDTYSELYSASGERLLSEEFKVAGSYKEYLYITKQTKTYTDNMNEYYELVFVDAKLGKICRSRFVDSPDTELKLLDSLSIDGDIIISVKRNDSYDLLYPNGYSVVLNVKSYCIIGDRIFTDTGFNIYYLTRYAQDYCDVCVKVSVDDTSMLLLGDIKDGCIVYRAMGTKGYEPHDYYFKEYSKEEDGIVVKLCDEDGKDLNTLAFIDKKLGRVTVFEGAKYLSKFINGRVFVTMKEDRYAESYTSSCYLATYQNVKVKDVRRVIYNFTGFEFGVFEKSLAIVESESGEKVYMDASGKIYPMTKKDAESISDWEDASNFTRRFQEPLR